MSFDRVIANPPFSLKKWGKEEADNDPYGRYPYGTPPKDAGDLAFIQHMIASLNEEGRWVWLFLMVFCLEVQVRKQFVKVSLRMTY